MTSSIILEPGFGDSRQRPRWYRALDGAYETSVDNALEGVEAVWDLTDYLKSGQSIASASYEDRGSVSSGKSLASPKITFTLTGVGETQVTANLNTGGPVIRRFRIIRTDNWRRLDYGQ